MSDGILGGRSGVAETMIPPAGGDLVVDKPRENEGPVEVLMRLAAGVQVFRSEDGRIFGQVPLGGRHEIFALKGTTFRDWLVNGYFVDRHELPSDWAVRRVLRAVESFARFDTRVPPVFIRVGREHKGVRSVHCIDLGDSSGKAIEMGPDGWAVVDRPGAAFWRPEGLLALPIPGRLGSINLLKPFVNLNEPDFWLLVGWMAAAIRPDGPFPILVIHGEQGSAKSTLAKIVRLLIDPQSAPLVGEPESTRDLMVNAINGWLLAFDNVSVVPNWLADSLCRLSSGGGFAARALFSDVERSVIHAQRPIMLSGIDEFVRRSDLADRVVFLYLPPIPPTSRREDVEFWMSFHALYPRILGGLLDAVGGGLRELPSVKLTELPRMADFARFGEAVTRGLGSPAGTFITAYTENRRDASGAAIEDSPLGNYLLETVVGNGGLMALTQPPSAMLDMLSDGAGRRIARSPRWPKSPAMLTNELRRLAPQLRAHGIHVIFSRTHKSRLITINSRRGSGSSVDTP